MRDTIPRLWILGAADRLGAVSEGIDIIALALAAGWERVEATP